MRSPGRPPPPREVQRRFWAGIAEGLSSEDAALACGVSAPVGTRWFREGGGMSPVSLAPPSGRYLSFAEREEIAIMKALGWRVREIARWLGRSPSTISRELRRNAATRRGRLEYRASIAQWKAERAARRPKIAKLAADERLRAYVQERLAGVTSVSVGEAPGASPVAAGADRLGRLQVDQRLQHQLHAGAHHIQIAARAQCVEQLGQGILIEGHRFSLSATARSR